MMPKTMPKMMPDRIEVIVTVPPYAPFIKEVVNHPLVSGLRLNTVMPIKGTLEDTLKRLQEQTKNQTKDKAKDKELLVDLKCRQLRVKTHGIPPFTEIELTHRIEVETPVKAYFSDGEEEAMVLEVDGNRLIMQEGPKRMVGPGESINIPHPSLKVEGYLTETDRRYCEAMQKVGLHKYMLSFVEHKTDAETLQKIDPEAEIIEKIESQRGLFYVDEEWNGRNHLMAAQGDLYVEVKKPHQIVSAVEKILAKDPGAIAASRILPSLADNLYPRYGEIMAVDNLLRMGYKTLMLGDDVCQKRESVMSALNLLQAIGGKYI